MIRCIVIDDEPLALRQMESYIQKIPFLENVSLLESALFATDVLKNEPIDLMFVDINMPDLNGMDFVKTLVNPPKVIFTTAYADYALEGFKVDALDYLLKPICFTDFLKSANKARAWFETQQTGTVQVKNDEEFLFLHSDYRIVRINLKEINYIEAMNEYVKIYLSGNKPIMSLISMKQLEQNLNSQHFMRVHRSYIVNLSKITVIERNRIVFDGKVYIPISDQYKETFQEYLNKNFI